GLVLKIRKIPIPAGFNKRKLKIALWALIGVLVITLIWVSVRNPVAESSPAAPAAQNYAKNDPNASIDDIFTEANNRRNSSASAETSPKQAIAVTVNNNSKEVDAQTAQELKTAMRTPLNSNEITAKSGVTLASVKDKDSTNQES